MNSYPSSATAFSEGDPSCRLAVLSLQPQPARRRRAAGRRQLRDNPVLGEEIWTADRPATEATSPSHSPRWHLGEVVCSIGGKRMFSGGPWMKKARFWISSFSGDAIGGRVILLKRLARNKVVNQRGSSPADWVSPRRRWMSSASATPGLLRKNNRAENSHLPSGDENDSSGASKPKLQSSVRHHPRYDLQHLLHPMTSDQSTNPLSLTRRGRWAAVAA